MGCVTHIAVSHEFETTTYSATFLIRNTFSSRTGPQVDGLRRKLTINRKPKSHTGQIICNVWEGSVLNEQHTNTRTHTHTITTRSLILEDVALVIFGMRRGSDDVQEISSAICFCARGGRVIKFIEVVKCFASQA